MEQIINAIEATNATVDQLVQQGNELCDDVDNLRAADERLSREVAAIRSSVAADVESNKEAIASQAKDLTEVRAAIAGVANDVVNLNAIVGALDARVANIEQQLNMIARLQNELADSLLRLAEARRPADEPAQTATPDMAALIARIPKPSAVRTRAAAQTVEDAPSDAAPAQTVVRKDAAPAQTVAKPAAKPAPRKSAPRTTTAVETRAYARQYMIENGAKVEQLRDPAAIEATVASDAFAAWLAAR